jgi:hypothetical protein
VSVSFLLLLLLIIIIGIWYYAVMNKKSTIINGQWFLNYVKIASHLSYVQNNVLSLNHKNSQNVTQYVYYFKQYSVVIFTWFLLFCNLVQFWYQPCSYFFKIIITLLSAWGYGCNIPVLLLLRFLKDICS